MPQRHASTATLPLAPAPGLVGGLAEGADSAQRVQVLLPLPLTGPYDYLVPPELAVEPGSVVPGSIVRAPLAQRELIGVVWDQPGAADLAAKPVPVEKLRPVLGVLPVPPLTAVARRFLAWVADYTLAAPGAVLRMALSSPAALEKPKPITLYQGCDRAPDDLRLTPARRRVLAELAQGPARSLADLAQAAGVGPSVVKGLVEAGAVEAIEVVAEPRFPTPDPETTGPTLSGQQAAAAESLRGAVRAAAGEEGFSVTLLDGVTGSGKTEVYFEAIAEAVAVGRQALVLLPEIALSAQWLERFERRFGVAPALWHSDLTSAQRRATWRAVAHGNAPVVVGARSALFLPFPDLGLIVVDEEHESAFKQEDGVTYHARDMAVVRAQLGGIPAVLVSATPSLESLNNVRLGRYQALHLQERHGGAVLPTVGLVDLRRDKPPKLEGLGPGWLSTPLRAAIAETLAAGEQVLLFLNRRGYAPLTLCRACGHRLQCPNCTAWLVEHRLAGRLQCHHCGFAARLPNACPGCRAEGTLSACGPGVERLAEETRVLFPTARQAMMTSDTLTGPQSAAELVRAVQARDVDLLIGTQIVAKGHHFPHLTLVGVVDADLGLYGGDLRAAERTYQLLHQVAGRAGRATQPGRVLLQTAEPDHPVMLALAAPQDGPLPDGPLQDGPLQDGQGRDRFFAAEAAARESAGLPPFGRLAALILSGPDPRPLDDSCRALARAAPQASGVTVLGPAPAPLAVLRGRHRRRFLVKAPRNFRLQALLRAWLGQVKLPNAVRLQIDIDPYSFL